MKPKTFKSTEITRTTKLSNQPETFNSARDFQINMKPKTFKSARDFQINSDNGVKIGAQAAATTAAVAACRRLDAERAKRRLLERMEDSK